MEINALLLRILLVFSFLLFFQFLNAQSEMDTVQYEMKDTVLAREMLGEGMDFIENNKFEDAIERLTFAERVCKKVAFTSSLLMGEIYFQLGRSYTMSGQYLLAESVYFKSLNLKKRKLGKENSEVAFLLNNIGNVYYYQSKYEEAIKYCQEALSLRLKLFGEDHIDVAASYLSMGAFFFQFEDYDRAFIHYKKAQKIWEKILGKRHRYVAMSYNNLGNCFEVKGDIQRAVLYFEKAIEIWQSIAGMDDPDLALSYYNIGNIVNELGDYEKAIEYHQLALNIRLNTVGGYHMETAKAYESIGDAWWNFKNKKKAIEYYDLARSINEKILSVNHPSLGRSYDQLGLLLKEEGKYDEALKYFNKSLKSKKEIYEVAHSSIAFSYSYIASVYNEKGETDLSISYYHSAIQTQIKSKTVNKKNVASFYRSIAYVYSEQGEFEKARSYVDSSLIYLDYNKNRPIENFYFSYDLLEAFILKSSIYQKLYYKKRTEDLIHKSKNAYETATKILYHQIKTISNSSRFIWVDKIHAVHENGLLTNQLFFMQNSDLKTLRESFLISERSKSLVLYQSIQETDALQYASIPDTLLEKEYDLRIDITYYEKKRQEKLSEGLEETDTTVLAISSKLFDLNREYEALKDRFEKEYPDYYKLKYDLSTVSLDYVQDTLLTADQTLLEYFVGDSSIFIFTVGQEQYDVVEVKRDFPLEDWVRQLQNGLTGYFAQPLEERTDELYKKTVQEYIQASRQLYDKLIAPVQEKLNTPELVVVSDGLLGYVPFGALLSGQPKRAGVFDTYPFLEKDYQISYCYSATLLREMKEKRHKRQPTGSLVAFAPFYEGSYAKLDSTLSLTFDTLANGQDTLIFNDVVTRKDFNNLPASGEEVKAASLFWDGDYYLNADATEDRFNEVAGNYRIVHLSTHGVADSRSGDYSYLVFAEQKDSLENEFLYVRDLYNTQLNAELVTLSACETAAGELQRGEGIISLARAFVYAGAKSIVTTLWVAEDVATRDLMKVFYRQMKSGSTKDKALQAAKMELLENNSYAHPFFWAGFVPVGDMRAMD